MGKREERRVVGAVFDGVKRGTRGEFALDAIVILGGKERRRVSAREIK